MMNKTALVTAVSAAAIFVAGCSSNDSDTNKSAEPAPVVQKSDPYSVIETADLQLVAKVKAIDYTTRRVTLVDSSGAAMDVIAGSQVKRLNEVKVGDTVKIKSTVSVLVEVRAATPEEVATPVAAVEVTGRASSASPPAGGMGRALRVVTTVERTDVPNMLVTLKGPRGDTTTVRARNVENVKKLHVGDTVVLTYTEAVAAEIVPAK
jgi:hypothetical protein